MAYSQILLQYNSCVLSIPFATITTTNISFFPNLSLRKSSNPAPTLARSLTLPSFMFSRTSSPAEREREDFYQTYSLLWKRPRKRRPFDSGLLELLRAFYAVQLVSLIRWFFCYFGLLSTISRRSISTAVFSIICCIFCWRSKRHQRWLG